MNDVQCFNLNPVIVAKHFQYRVETFFREVLLTDANPIGEIVYYALRIEFQMRGSPHLHALIWTSDCPELTNNTKDAYIDYIDQRVHAYLPDKETDSQLYDLVKTYQTHNHSKTCRKYKNVECRFNFGQFFTDNTIVAEPLPEDMDEGIKQNLSAQECVYRCLPELWLRKIFPKTVFISTDFSENRVRFTKTQQELDELDDDSTDIFKSNIIVRYSERPINIPVIKDMCLALFAAHYFKDYKSDSQPEVLTDDFIECKNVDDHSAELPKTIKLMNSKEVMKCRKVKAVMRYHTPNRAREPEKYFHHLLMLYLPWRDEQELVGHDETFISKFYETEAQTVVQRNKEMFEPDGDAINEALEILRNFDDIPTRSYDTQNDQENEDLRQNCLNNFDEMESFNESLPQHLAANPASVQPSSGIVAYNPPSDISDDVLRQIVRSLNKEQRYAYDAVLSWCRDRMANLNPLKPSQVDPIHLFVSGGGGKSHLIRAIYHTVTKIFKHAPANPELPSVLLTAPTVVAAININGTTIHSALAIPKACGDNVPAMSDQKRTQMRLSLAELKLIIIDEISMV